MSVANVRSIEVLHIQNDLELFESVVGADRDVTFPDGCNLFTLRDPNYWSFNHVRVVTDCATSQRM
jgi:hypothetical protein